METPQTILDKIKKLKALSEGAFNIGSIAESEAATLAMNRLLTKYNLSLLDIDETDANKPSVEIGQSELVSVQNPYGRLWKERLLMVLCRYNYCKMIGYSYKVFVLGTQINTMTVIDFFNTLQSVYLHSAKKEYDSVKRSFRGGKRTEAYKRKYITSYLLGCAIGLSVKLEKQKSEECTAVAIRHDKLIDEYCAQNFKLKSKLGKPVKTNDTAYERGFYEGMNTELRKTINQ